MKYFFSVEWWFRHLTDKTRMVSSRFRRGFVMVSVGAGRDTCRCKGDVSARAVVAHCMEMPPRVSNLVPRCRCALLGDVFTSTYLFVVSVLKHTPNDDGKSTVIGHN